LEEDGILTMLAKATLTQLTSLESLPVLWNPETYSLSRAHRLAAPAPLGRGPAPAQFCAESAERFRTRLFLDSTEERGAQRDLRAYVERFERWAEPEPHSGLQPGVLFQWGPFRFRGVIEALCQEWVLFDPDGTPTRGWLDLTLRR
jgi:hypothetical protein